jgi:hypothetical protein
MSALWQVHNFLAAKNVFGSSVAGYVQKLWQKGWSALQNNAVNGAYDYFSSGGKVIHAYIYVDWCTLADSGRVDVLGTS